jgi:hypothetical protein
LEVGAITLAVSIIYESSILALVGLSLTFWGALLLIVGTEKYVKQPLLDSTIIPSLVHLNQTLAELRYQGKGVYLPPEYLKDSETSRIFIPKNKNTDLPPPEEIQQQNDKLFLTNPEAMLIIPPGLSLSRLFEKTLGTSFTEVDLEYLQQNLPKLFIQNLEIAEDLEIQANYDQTSTKMTKRVSLIQSKYDTIQVKITNSVYKDTCRETRKLSRIRDAIGCPICSAIACALTKATGKPLIIEKTEVTKDGKTIEANFQLLEKIETEAFKAEVRPHADMGHLLHAFLLSNFAIFSLTVSGLIILAWVGWLIWHDTAMWGKDIPLIFFGSRTGEAISLGIGMRVIHYFLIGFALLLSGLLEFLGRKWSRV